MKKILGMILALVMCAAMLAGCGSSGTPNNNQNNDNQNNAATGNEVSTGGESSGPIQITDAYTFTDPADLDFDARYVLYMGSENPAVAMAADSGLTAQYMIIYAKEEKTLASYNLSIYDTAESAQETAEAMLAMGTTMNPVEGDDTVMYSYSDAAAMELVISSLNAAGLFPDMNTSSFVNFQVEMNGMTLVE